MPCCFHHPAVSPFVLARSCKILQGLEIVHTCAHASFVCAARPPSESLILWNAMKSTCLLDTWDNCPSHRQYRMETELNDVHSDTACAIRVSMQTLFAEMICGGAGGCEAICCMICRKFSCKPIASGDCSTLVFWRYTVGLRFCCPVSPFLYLSVFCVVAQCHAGGQPQELTRSSNVSHSLFPFSVWQSCEE